MSLPAMSRRLVRWGRLKPSYTGQMCVTPSPESTTTPVRRPETQTHSTVNNLQFYQARRILSRVCLQLLITAGWVNTHTHTKTAAITQLM